MKRYSRIEGDFSREMILLQGTGCFHKKCLFCDYYQDVSDAPFKVNRGAIEKVTGEFGVLDVINSGSANELDKTSLNLIAETARAKNIKTIWFEAHYYYHDKFETLRNFFDGIELKFRTGVESFNEGFRCAMKKGVPAVSPLQIRKYFQGVCLLVCIQGQNKEMILQDIEIAKKYFEYFSVNVFCENSTKVKRDDELYNWFMKKIAPALKKNKTCEVLVENTDLGLG